MDSVQTIVAGAGVVGLAVARSLAASGREVVVVEAAETFGTGTSSRNSEVIHAGLYYPPGTHKARLCLLGNRLLRAYCADRRIEHRVCGKLIVAAKPAQVAALEALWANGNAVGVAGLSWLDRDAVRDLEPALDVAAALLSASTGIVDSHGLMLSLAGEAEAMGAVVVYRSPITGGRLVPGGFELEIGGTEPTTLKAREFVNCAGLDAQAVARSIEGIGREHIPDEAYAQGTYFTLAGRSPFARLVYPMPEPGGLGIHLTLDLGGQAKFGPDVRWVERPDFVVDPGRAAAFYGAIRQYWPGLPDDALVPGYVGVRPKLKAAGRGFADFVIDGPHQHGIPGLVQLFGIESPGLTACLAIAQTVVALLRDG